MSRTVEEMRAELRVRAYYSAKGGAWVGLWAALLLIGGGVLMYLLTGNPLAGQPIGYGVFFLILAVTFAFTARARRKALPRGALDMPDERR